MKKKQKKNNKPKGHSMKIEVNGTATRTLWGGNGRVIVIDHSIRYKNYIENWDAAKICIYIEMNTDRDGFPRVDDSNTFKWIIENSIGFNWHKKPIDF